MFSDAVNWFRPNLNSRPILSCRDLVASLSTEPSPRVGNAKRIVVARGFGCFVPLARVTSAGPKRGSGADSLVTIGAV